MSSTSKKHSNFVSEPMGRKPVQQLPGVGKAIGQRLENAGYEKSSAVLGQYLVMNREPTAFKGWMKETGNANAKQSNDTYKCLKEWTNEFL